MACMILLYSYKKNLNTILHRDALPYNVIPSFSSYQRYLIRFKLLACLANFKRVLRLESGSVIGS